MEAMDALFKVLKIMMLTAFWAVSLYLLGMIVWLFIRACVGAMKAAWTGKDETL
jgi:hypothetical protein